MPFDEGMRLQVWIAWGRLVHHFSMFGAYSQSEVVTGAREAIRFILHLLLSFSVKGAVISGQKICDDRLFHVCDSLQAHGLEQFAFSSVPDRDSVITFLESVGQHC